MEDAIITISPPPPTPSAKSVDAAADGKPSTLPSYFQLPC